MKLVEVHTVSRNGTQAKLRVFLSSTKADLESERLAVHESLQRDFDVVWMEDFGSRDAAALKTCLDEIERVDAVVVLVGERYGTLSSTGDSYTEAEYERAQQCGIETFAYIQRQGRDSVTAEDEARQIKLQDFRAKLNNSHTIRKPDFAPGKPGMLGTHVARDLRVWKDTGTRRPTFDATTKRGRTLGIYATGKTRYESLQAVPFSVILVDTAALGSVGYPETKGRRMSEKIQGVLADQRQSGLQISILNNIPAGDVRGETIRNFQIRLARERAALLVCVVKGQADLGEVSRFAGAAGEVAVFHLDSLTLPQPADYDYVRTYTQAQFNQCDLTLQLLELLEARVNRHVLETFATRS